MINPGVLYEVVGRYMDGQKVLGYHLVGEDGSESAEFKENIIWLIGQNVIVNMYIQVGADNEAIIRGKGVNLNNLPKYNLNKLKSNTGGNIGGSYKILKRILFKGCCVGYEVQEPTGESRRKTKEQVIQLAIKKQLVNAEANRYKKPETNTYEIGLSGVGCDLRKLPILIVNEQGKIVDPKADMTTLTARAVYLKHAGVLHDNTNNVCKYFKSGDFIICMPDGSMDVLNKISVDKYFRRDYERSTATCDHYVGMRQHYSLEMYGGKTVALVPQIVSTWAILKPVDTAK